MSQTSISKLKLPAVKEDVNYLKQRVQDLEREVGSYKSRLDELRKAKNNLIIKKTTEYVKTGSPALGLSREKNSSPENEQSEQVVKNNDNTNTNNEEYEKIINNLTNELNESKNLVAALRIENEDAKTTLEKTKKDYQVEIAEAYAKHEEYKREIKQWEVMYKEWMSMMEDRVTNINRTHQILQQCITQQNPTVTNPEQGSSE